MALIRKVILVLLSVGALAMLVAGGLSYWRGMCVSSLAVADKNLLHGWSAELGNTLWIDYFSGQPRVQLGMIKGILHVVYSKPVPPPQGLAIRSTPVPKEARLWQFYAKSVGLGVVDSTGVGAPFWVPAIFLALWPSLALARGPYRRYRRRKQNRCLHCGYLLTGNISGVCPECGSAAGARLATCGVVADITGDHAEPARGTAVREN